MSNKNHTSSKTEVLMAYVYEWKSYVKISESSDWFIKLFERKARVVRRKRINSFLIIRMLRESITNSHKYIYIYMEYFYSTKSRGFRVYYDDDDHQYYYYGVVE